MVSTSAATMAMPLTYSSQKSVSAFFTPLPMRTSKAAATSRSNVKFQVRAFLKEQALARLTVVALTANMMIPRVAEAAELTPSLKNFLLSILAGGVVLMVLVGVVIAISNFNPVKRS